MGASVSLSIGALARQAGCAAPSAGARSPRNTGWSAPCSEAGQRLYGDAALRRLSFIRRCRNFSFSIDQVRELASLIDEPERPCIELRDVAAAQLREVRQKLVELRELESGLATVVENCNAACVGGTAVDCTILEGLMPADGAQAAGSQRRGCCG